LSLINKSIVVMLISIHFLAAQEDRKLLSYTILPLLDEVNISEKKALKYYKLVPKFLNENLKKIGKKYVSGTKKISQEDQHKDPNELYLELTVLSMKLSGVSSGKFQFKSLSTRFKFYRNNNLVHTWLGTTESFSKLSGSAKKAVKSALQSFFNTPSDKLKPLHKSLSFMVDIESNKKVKSTSENAAKLEIFRRIYVKSIRNYLTQLDFDSHNLEKSNSVGNTDKGNKLTISLLKSNKLFAPPKRGNTNKNPNEFFQRWKATIQRRYFSFINSWATKNSR